MFKYVENHQEEMLTYIERLVNIDSGTSNKLGVDLIGTILQKEYLKLGFAINVKHEREYGNHLIIQHKEAKNPKIIILAHMDTVFEKGTVATRPFMVKGDRAYGPGVIDMKSSLITLLYAIKALINKRCEGYKNIKIIINSDEERGSLTSRALIEEHAVGTKYALVMEPARKNGALVSARKGKGNYTLIVKGKAAHSGIEPERGRSAIEELAHKIIQFHELSDPDNGINVNVGIIEGGSSVNTVSDFATAQIDIRISEMNQISQLENKIEEICGSTDVSGTRISIKGEIYRPPMQKNKKTRSLLKVIQEVGEKIGVEIEDTATGGGSDASFTAALGIATIDGLGPVGGNPHSENEYLEIKSLIPRTVLLATIIQRLTEKEMDYSLD